VTDEREIEPREEPGEEPSHLGAFSDHRDDDGEWWKKWQAEHGEEADRGADA
jgi:hypothetical protein